MLLNFVVFFHVFLSVHHKLGVLPVKYWTWVHWTLINKRRLEPKVFKIFLPNFLAVFRGAGLNSAKAGKSHGIGLRLFKIKESPFLH